MKKYIISVTGPIGSGKSSLIKGLLKHFSKTHKTRIIPEFIDGDPIFGLEMLKRFIDNTISSLTFQSYILDYYKNIINKQTDDEIILIEKLPYDSVYCFGTVAVKNKLLTQTEFDVLVQKLEKLDALANLPSYKKCLITLDTNTKFKILEQAIDIINKDINDGIDRRAIYLKCNLETCKERILIRNRSGEENYTDEYLKQIVDFYASF